MGTNKPIASSRDFLAPGAFGRVEARLHALRNITTNTMARELRGSKVIEMGEREIILQIPHASCSRGHNLLLELFIQPPEPTPATFFSATGIVNAMDALDPFIDCVQVKLQQYNKKEWDACLWIYSSQQSEIDALLSDVRGIESPAGSSEARDLGSRLAQCRVLVADTNPAAQARISQIFLDLGVRPENLFSVESFAQARTKMRDRSPEIVLAEYYLGDANGLELAQIRSSQANRMDRVFIIITENCTQTAIAKAAEEDVDAFILKPFSSTGLRDLIVKTAARKLVPQPYLQAIEAGKSLIDANDFEGAKAKFSGALELDPVPALAQYYLGEVALRQSRPHEAEAHFKLGLQLNKIHSRCMSGLYEALDRQGKHEAAYDALKRLCQYFPATPRRLEDALRLSVMTRRYEDIERFFGLYQAMEEHPESLVKCMCAALIVCGKYYLQTHNRTRALDVFKAATEAGDGRPHVMREITSTVLEHGLDPVALVDHDVRDPRLHDELVFRLEERGELEQVERLRSALKSASTKK